MVTFQLAVFRDSLLRKQQVTLVHSGAALFWLLRVGGVGVLSGGCRTSFGVAQPTSVATWAFPRLLDQTLGVRRTRCGTRSDEPNSVEPSPVSGPDCWARLGNVERPLRCAKRTTPLAKPRFVAIARDGVRRLAYADP
jgi:hypothetical protein